MMHEFNSFEIFMVILSTPLIIAAVWHMYVKYFRTSRKGHKDN
jgi:hypothetical protein